MATGKVKWFNITKGYGFIIPDEGGKDIFVHRSKVKEVGNILKEGQLVEYEIGEGRKGPEAINVTVTGSSAEEQVTSEVEEADDSRGNI